MTVPPDGQPLTRRQLRDLERTGHASPAVSDEGTPAAAEAPESAQNRRARSHSEPAVSTGEELRVVATAANGEISDEEAELAEVEDAQTHPISHITIDQNPSVPVTPGFSSSSPSAPERPTTAPRVAQTTDSPFDDIIASRGVGASNSISTTSALVLPSVPHHGDVGSALDETGEVIITGSIDLPPSLSSTGASPAAGLERSDLDSLVEGADRDQTGSDVAPISASRAVSTHGSPIAMVAPPKRARVNAPLILAITAGVLAVGVVGLLLAAFVFRVF